MAKSARELLQHYKTSQHEPYLQKIRGTYLFEVEDAGTWRISVQDGTIAITEDNEGNKEADCVISCNEQDFIDIAEGRRNMLTAVLQGRVHIRGDAALAQKVHGIVRANFERQMEKQKELRGAA